MDRSIRFLLALLSLLCSTSVWAQQVTVQQPRLRTVALQNGVRITGTILEESPDSLRLQTGEGTVQTIAMADIRMIHQPDKTANTSEKPAPAKAPAAVPPSAGKAIRWNPFNRAPSAGNTAVAPAEPAAPLLETIFLPGQMLPGLSQPAPVFLLGVNLLAGINIQMLSTKGAFAALHMNFQPAFYRHTDFQHPFVNARAGKQLATKGIVGVGVQARLHYNNHTKMATAGAFLRTDTRRLTVKLGTSAGAGVSTRVYDYWDYRRSRSWNNDNSSFFWDTELSAAYRISPGSSAFVESSVAYGAPNGNGLIVANGGAQFAFDSIRITPSLQFTHVVTGNERALGFSYLSPSLEISLAF